MDVKHSVTKKERNYTNYGGWVNNIMLKYTIKVSLSDINGNDPQIQLAIPC